MDSTVSTREMGVEKEDQGNRKWYHGWLDSTVSTGEMVVKEENQEHRRKDHSSQRGDHGLTGGPTDIKKVTLYKVRILHLPFLQRNRAH
jgi:hypothetical protein